MGALIINADNQTSKLIKALAEKMGAGVISLKQDQYEDLLLGMQMDEQKTGETVPREEIMKILKSK